jgi:flavin reductase (DIM6/NTAB) family NADH-FMN oxidoreductase RutF
VPGYLTLHADQRKVRDNFYLLLSAIAPRPVALISTMSKAGIGNLAPYGHINIGGANPPSIVICAMTDRFDKVKDTPKNILETGEFVVNICSREFIGRVNECSRPDPEEDNELELYGFTPLPSLNVKPPRIAESALHMECRLHDTLVHGSGPLHSTYIVAEVVTFHVREDVLSIDGQIDPTKFDYVGRLGIDWFCEVKPETLFKIDRPF